MYGKYTPLCLNEYLSIVKTCLYEHFFVSNEFPFPFLSALT